LKAQKKTIGKGKKIRTKQREENEPNGNRQEAKKKKTNPKKKLVT